MCSKAQVERVPRRRLFYFSCRRERPHEEIQLVLQWYCSRLDTEQSIRGGAKYFKRMIAMLPDRIPSPDRILFALASYNIGFGHLNDARIITQRQGGDPDRWVEVKTRLPLLQQKKYYKNTKYGYARGEEPVHYVDNIRR